jgi:hypothetical protein
MQLETLLKIREQLLKRLERIDEAILNCRVPEERDSKEQPCISTPTTTK